MTITGVIRDAVTEQPLPGASVTVVTNTGVVLAGTAADSTGYFNLSSSHLDNLSNKVRLSYVGYNPETISTSGAGGTMWLTKTGSTLDTVVVTAKRSAKQNGGKIITVAAVLIIIKTIFKI